jgi:hypothetical protein
LFNQVTDDLRRQSWVNAHLAASRWSAMSAVPSIPVTGHVATDESDGQQCGRHREFEGRPPPIATVRGCGIPARRTHTRVDPPRTEGRYPTSLEGGNRGDRHGWLFKAPKHELAVGDGHPVRVARQVGQHRCGPRGAWGRRRWSAAPRRPRRTTAGPCLGCRSTSLAKALRVPRPSAPQMLRSNNGHDRPRCWYGNRYKTGTSLAQKAKKSQPALTC